MTETEQALELARDFAAKASEFVDTVQVFLTVYDPTTGITRHVVHGIGNWFAREGQIREWVTQNEEKIRHEATMEDDDE